MRSQPNAWSLDEYRELAGDDALPNGQGEAMGITTGQQSVAELPPDVKDLATMPPRELERLRSFVATREGRAMCQSGQWRRAFDYP